MVNGQQPMVNGQSDSIRVTLLTCSPGPEVYELYGHTAIRVQTPSTGRTLDEESFPLEEGEAWSGSDVVFNYGVFDMSKPYFAWHFVLGETDYMVQPIPWKYFVREYEERGSSITEQELNLTSWEAQRLTSRLIENCLPENREYRYNFLYKNCTTMVRDMVEDAINGRIQYPDTLPHQTYREILHRYTAEHPWAQEGNDLLLGADVDTVLSERAAMFVPDNLMQAFDGAFICTPRGDMRPLVRSKAVLIAKSEELRVKNESNHLDGSDDGNSDSSLFTLHSSLKFTPLSAMLAFGIICIIIMLLEVWAKRIFWLWDVLLLLLQGAAGTLLTFMFFFSGHPAVDSNWQIWLLNPIVFVGIPLVIISAIKHKPTRWYAFQFTVLALFLLFSPWIPQVFAKITVPLALCLLTRPISYYLLRGKGHGARGKRPEARGKEQGARSKETRTKEQGARSKR